MMAIVCVHTVKFIMSSKGPNAKELSDGKRWGPSQGIS